MIAVLYPVRLGDRGRRAAGWLVLSEGAVRGILSAGMDGEVILTAACDRRIQSDPPMIFRDLAEAQAWLSKRLRGTRRRSSASTH